MEDKIRKLPKWAQKHINDLERQKKVAMDALSEYLDNQTESVFSVTDILCTEKSPRLAKKYIQAHMIDIETKHIECTFFVREGLDGDVIDIGFNGKIGKDVFIQPRACNSIYLIAKDR